LELAELSLSPHWDYSFAPAGAVRFLTFYPQLALWAAFLRRFAAEGRAYSAESAGAPLPGLDCQRPCIIH